jgi:hypothetical protein
MVLRRRFAYGVVIAVVVAAVIVGVLLFLGVWSSRESAPDLTALVRQLTSADPRVQVQALVPTARTGPWQTSGVLPAGSVLRVEPKTWQVTGADTAGAPSVGRVRARLTWPGQAATEIDLDVVKVGDRWLLYGTSPL